MPTSSSVSVEGVEVEEINDNFFARKREESKEEMFDNQSEHNPSEALTEERRTMQKSVDDALLPHVQGVELMEAYLRSTFSLKKGDKPHLMRF